MPHLLFLSIVFLFSLSFWGPSPALAVPMQTDRGPTNSAYFSVLNDGHKSINSGNNPGTISYAGGSSPLVGHNIAIYEIVAIPVTASESDLTCVSCSLNFSSGSFAGSSPSSDPGHPGNDYSFHGGGSLTITGGATGAGFSLPGGTVLLHGVLSGAVLGGGENGRGATEVTGLILQSAVLHPDLISHFAISNPYTAEAVLTTTEMSSAPNPFVLSTFTFNDSGDSSSLVVNGNLTVPLPDTFWPFALGLLILLVWWEYRSARAQNTG